MSITWPVCVLFKCVITWMVPRLFQEWCHWEYATIGSTERWVLWSPRTLSSIRVSGKAHWLLWLMPCSLTCRYVDEGRNPELFTRHQLERTLSDHIGIQKKVQAYKVTSLVSVSWWYIIIIVLSLFFVQDFREQLIHQLEPVFPEEIQAYVALSEFSKREQR